MLLGSVVVTSRRVFQADLGLAANNHLAGVNPLLPGRWGDGFPCQRPKPQGAPGIHDSPQPAIRPIGVSEGLFDLLTGDRRLLRRRLPAPQRDLASGLLLGHHETAQRHRPQLLSLIADIDQLAYLSLRRLGPHLFAPLLHRGNAVRGKLLGLFRISGRTPPGPGQQPVRDVPGSLSGARVVGLDAVREILKRHIGGRGAQPLLRRHLIFSIHGAASTNERITPT